MNVLVCGGGGYIGSHVCAELILRGHDIVIFDNYSNSSPDVTSRLEKMTGRQVLNVDGDIRDFGALKQVFSDYSIDVVVHCAALKSVGESWRTPLKYFDNNINGTVTLLRAMDEFGVRNLIFSSSATVYGIPDSSPVREDAPLRVTNPYGRTKLVMEELIGDLASSNANFRAAVLRYFNPVGAHESGAIGERPSGRPDNLMPFVCQVAGGHRSELNVFGSDYPTADGTGVRDYIHVMDLSRAHVDAIDYLTAEKRGLTVNLGTGHGYSVLEVVSAFERVTGKRVPLKFCPRRPGDVAVCFADPSEANRLLGWRAQFGIEEMCRDAWRWQSRLPDGH